MKSLFEIAVNALLPAYILISLITLPHCTGRDESTAGRLKSAKQYSANLLLQKFDARLFNINSGDILNRPVVLDTLMMGIFRKDGQDFLRAEVRCGGDKKYYAELRCGSEIINAYRRTKSNSAFLVAKISRIDDCAVVAEADSLDGKTARYN
ncbi:MAG: hypothetical protein WC061_09930, partial [Melioribacteraceae bacterium]